jgi:hypothetical protein
LTLGVDEQTRCYKASFRVVKRAGDCFETLSRHPGLPHFSIDKAKEFYAGFVGVKWEWEHGLPTTRRFAQRYQAMN